MELTREIAYKAISDFFSVETPFVLFATGTSCALDLNFGMPALEKHLRDRLSTGLNEEQAKQWQQVVGALAEKTHDFESAMNFIKDDELTNKIVALTASFVAQHDHNYSHQIISGSTVWPAGKLFKKLVDTLPETDRQLHVATPNYDLLAEYSFIFERQPYLTGFHGGYCKSYNWDECSKSVKYLERSPSRKRVKPVLRERKHIRLYKPHGSLNTFVIGDRVVECDAWIKDPPVGVLRSMITPGTSKYQRLHDDRTQLGDYDRAVQNHSRFLFLGFGFNDSQLVNNTFKQKLEHDHCHALVITRDTNKRLTEWLSRCPNMWLICKIG
ncbi:SIR2 family protein [Endozoicomonas sp. SCSIO W0465]|uniref:SIR2 family protein n=1 Tax=Endozoicomonas sp. SCSIO W0465 TaxID=2918516 RepID=UPI0020758380|nr:SIR2 family protein [Endozoicomonas sp. SCSIO W0465]USE35004.1 SIR2 family protein [Endozoicomonas sp. SCSIO W0465]